MASDRELWQCHQGGQSYAEIAEDYGLSAKSIRGRVNRYKRQQQGTAELLDQMAELYWPSVRDSNDLDQWSKFLTRQQRKNRLLKILLWPDLHFPDCNLQALALQYRITKRVKPDVHFFNGDVFDFDTLSLKWVRSHHRKNRDAFKEVGVPWMNFQQALRKLDPSSAKVMVGGNHDRDRIEKLINDRIPFLGETLIEDFLGLIRADGHIWWLGWTNEIWVGPLLVTHGDRVGENAAKNSMKDLGWASPRISSHTHAPSTFYNVIYLAGKRHVVESVVSPCLCNIHPHYRLDKRRSRWINGATLISVDLDGMEVHFENLIFRQRENGDLVTVLAGEEIIEHGGVAQRSLYAVQSR